MVTALIESEVNSDCDDDAALVKVIGDRKILNTLIGMLHEGRHGVAQQNGFWEAIGPTL